MTIVDELVARLGFDYKPEGVRQFNQGMEAASNSLLNVKTAMKAVIGLGVGAGMKQVFDMGFAVEKLDRETGLLEISKDRLQIAIDGIQ